jgi:HK97 family phage major capsid protein
MKDDCAISHYLFSKDTSMERTARLSDLTREYLVQQKGEDLASYCMHLVANKGSIIDAANQGQRLQQTRPRVARILRAAQEAGTTSDPVWAAPLSDYTSMSGEFIEALGPRTFIGRLQGFRRVDPNTRTLTQDNGSSASWVGQAQPKPISAMSFDTVQLGIAKVSSICVFTEEVVKFMRPANVTHVRNSMLTTCARFINQQFINPAVVAVPDVSPASVTNGITPISSTGSTVSAITADLSGAMQRFIDAENDMTSAVWVLHPRSALALSMLRESGARAFPGISVLGGELLGLPAVTSAAVPISNETGSPTIVCLLDPSRILLADDDLITLDASRNAALQMVDDPATGSQQLVSLWQFGLSAARVERWVNWKRADDSAVVVIDNVTY